MTPDQLRTVVRNVLYSVYHHLDEYLGSAILDDLVGYDLLPEADAGERFCPACNIIFEADGDLSCPECGSDATVEHHE